MIMKRTLIISVCFLLVTAFFSCEKNAIQEIDSPLGEGAQIKFFNFAAGAPSVNFYANDVKLSATFSATGTESAIGVAYGLVFPFVNYSQIEQGTYDFKGQLPSTAAADANLAIAALSAQVENNKYYSFYTSGVYNATAKTADAFIVEDVLPAPDTRATYIRFVNAISNAPAGFDLVVKNTTSAAETLVATNIAYKSGSDFVEIPPGVYELYARYTGTAANVISRSGTQTVSYLPGRVYTVTSSGNITILTGAPAPFLDNTTNR